MKDRAEYVREYRSEDFRWFKNHGMCVQCRKEKAARGRTMCADCLDRHKEWARKYREREPERSRESSDICHKRLYEKRKQAGLCVSCGSRPPKEGRVRCGICLARHRRSAEKIRRKRGQWSRQEMTEPGVCYMCHAPSLPDKRLCGVCRGKALINLAKANMAIDHYKHPWRAKSFRFGKASEG